MPPVATWRGTRLPRTITAAEVDAVLGICDRSTASGRRDYAILCLLARLGLRCGEVAALQLGDVDWRCGEIVVRGKARRQDRLPLPVQVGEALAAYLREDRPACACPQLILTLYAPPRPIHPASITNVVYRACRRAGLAPVGGHRLRHALATEMLRRGGNLIEIAQVLRHPTSGPPPTTPRSTEPPCVLLPNPGRGPADEHVGRHAEEYLRLRQALGHELADAARLLPRFVAYLDAVGASKITTDVALAWVQRPDADPASSVWARRMTVVRGFARHMSGIDPATEVPPLGLVSFRGHWRPPFIYSAADIEALMTEVPRLVPTPLRAATFQTMIGLLAATGLRVGEAIALDRGDIDWAEGVLVVRASKFNKTREVPVDPTTIDALSSYARIRGRHVPQPASPTFFVSGNGTPVRYAHFGTTFRELVTASGVGADSTTVPASTP